MVEQIISLTDNQRSSVIIPWPVYAEVRGAVDQSDTMTDVNCMEDAPRQRQCCFISVDLLCAPDNCPFCADSRPCELM